MENKITSHVLKGFIIACILIVLDLVLQKLYNPVPERLRYLSGMAITFAGVLASCIIYSKQLGVKTVFGDGFSHGLKTAAVIAFIMAVYTFIAVKFIYPPPGAAEMEAAIKAIEQQGNALYEEAKQQAFEAAKNRWIIYVSISIFASLIPGLLASVIGGLVTKKEPLI